MNYHHKAYCVAFAGMKGTGKTTKFLELWEKHRAKYKFAFDPDRELARKLKLRVCVSIEQMKAALKCGYPVVFDPVPMFAGDLKSALDFFCRWVIAVCKTFHGVKLLSVEEIQKFVTCNVGGVPKSLNEILDAGRREEIDFMCVVNKGMNRLPEDIRSQLTEIYVFKTVGRRALEWMEEEGFDIERVRNLGMPDKKKNIPSEFIHKNI